MYRIYVLQIIFLFCSCSVFGQSDSTLAVDSIQPISLKEVVVISSGSALSHHTKSLSTVDGYLEKFNSISMIRRGPYAWEPFLNGMASERSVITVDGMRIYAACTDKMDPTTSYVEITNLAQANVHNGQMGSSGGSTTAGTLDLVRRRSYFGEKKFEGMVFSGLESNNEHKIAGLSLSLLEPRWFTDIDVTYRDANNYKAGGGKEILYSPFKKFNISATTGFKINDRHHMEASVVYDDASDVGYPALPMDVSQAEAFIGSLEYVRHHLTPVIDEWKTKIYYNDVTHVMDDSRRPDVPIRMDMPGWSKTTGFSSTLKGRLSKHSWIGNISGHHNESLAEMTMYSNNPNEKDMFMLTWPGVDTYYLDLYGEDSYALSEKWKLISSAGVALQNNRVNNTFGLASLQIFYPDMQQSKSRLLKRVATSVQHEFSAWQYTFGAAYGERAPGVSEGYGFYLFNSFDRFDYIGNPDMSNEKSLDFNGTISYTGKRTTTKLSGSYFHILDYIIGKPASELSAMTIGAAGVKVYEQLRYAQLINGSVDFRYQWSSHWSNEVKLIYRKGTGANHLHLPLIQPLTYFTNINYVFKSFRAEATMSGAVKQTEFSPEFGEAGAPAYAIFNFTVSQRIDLDKQQVLIKLGVENLTDKYYTTFADWNRLPRMGRNIFMNVIFSF